MKMELSVVKKISGVELFLPHCKNTPLVSPDIEIDGSAVFQLKILYSKTEEYWRHFFSVRFAKLRSDDDLTYTACISSTKLNINDKRFTSDKGEWRLLTTTFDEESNIDMSVRMDVLPCVNSFASLHEDTELVDFELRGADGVVRVHRTVLAAASPVLRRMLCGEWREAAEGYVDVPGTTRATLQHLKDYIYMHTLPETGFEQLLLLSSYYMMPDLERKCVDKLVDNVSADSTFKLLEFAAQQKVWRLTLGIVECVQNGRISANDIK